MKPHFREEGGEKVCQLRELIRDLCPSWGRTREDFKVGDIDFPTITYIHDGKKEYHILTFVEKKIEGAPEHPWQVYNRKLIARIQELGIRELQKLGEKIIWNGYHLVRVPNDPASRESYKNWPWVQLNEEIMGYRDLARFLSNEQVAQNVETFFIE